MNLEKSTEGAEQVVAEIETQDYMLTIELLDQEVHCLASITLKPEGEPLTSDDLFKYLAEAGITVGIDTTAVEQFCYDAVLRNEPSNSAILASGSPPQKGMDGSFKLLTQVSSDEALYQADTQGKINYRERRAFENVKNGQVVGKIIPPNYGKPGHTVTGLPIPAELGKAASVLAGKGIRFDDDSICALSDGRLICEENTLAISDEFLVEGDVDLKTGNINFAGFVNVTGDVFDDFNIKATKGIQIGGSIGACEIVSGGDVTVVSVFGKGRCIIRCLGDLHAEYLSGVTVECYGNVVVGREIRDSDIKALGSIRVENGTICGGTCTALAGVEAKTIGSVSWASTTIRAGISFLDSDRETFLKRRLGVIDFQEENIKYTIGKATPELLATCREVVKLRFELLGKILEKIDKDKEIFSQELKSVTSSQKESVVNPKINVRHRLYEGVNLELGNVKERIRFEKDDPCSIIASKKDDSLLYLMLSPLSVKADDLEKKTIEDYGLLLLKVTGG